MTRQRIDNSPSRLRQWLRLVAYVFLGITTVFILILYLAYLSAQRTPEFYQEALEVPQETQELRNKEMLRSVRNLNNEIQENRKPWEAAFTAEALNAYFAVEAAKIGANLLPREIKEPRVFFSPQGIELACRVEQGAASGILHLGLGVSLPEPNRLTIRVRDTKLGTLPISREKAAGMVKRILEKSGRPVQQGREAGDPTLTFPLDMKVGKMNIIVEDMEIQRGKISFSGRSTKK